MLKGGSRTRRSTRRRRRTLWRTRAPPPSARRIASRRAPERSARGTRSSSGFRRSPLGQGGETQGGGHRAAGDAAERTPGRGRQGGARAGGGAVREADAARAEARALLSRVDDQKKKLEESQALLVSNQQMIQWLNGQVNEAQLGRLGAARDTRSDRPRRCPPHPCRRLGVRRRRRRRRLRRLISDLYMTRLVRRVRRARCNEVTDHTRLNHTARRRTRASPSPHPSLSSLEPAKSPAAPVSPTPGRAPLPPPSKHHCAALDSPLAQNDTRRKSTPPWKYVRLNDVVPSPAFSTSRTHDVKLALHRGRATRRRDASSGGPPVRRASSPRRRVDP